MKTHKLKVWKQYFEDLRSGMKTFEVRNNDRDFKVNDRLILMEWDNENKELTGRECVREVQYILKGGQFGIDKDFVVMSIAKLCY